jgi:membrane peptidoglycan carboxypeptidase/fibronectin type 3 domain-containing protein
MEEQSFAHSTDTEQQPERKQKKKKKRFWKVFKLFLFLFLGVSVIGGGAAAGYVATLVKKAPPLDLNAITNMAATTKVYDADQQFMFDLQGDGDRELIKSLDQVSPYVVNAFIAAEDKDFRSHFGINPVALARATVQNLMGRGIMSGASTITQQTIKNAMFPEQDRTLERKVQEMYLAINLEKQLTKDEILVTYLNWIYFGKSGPDNLYGIERASQAIFGVSAKDLNLAQSTILAALPNNPSLFTPYDHLDATQSRQEYILNEMVQDHFITQAEADEAKAYDVAKDIQAVKEKKSVKGGEFAHLNAEIETQAAEKLMESGKYGSLDEARQALFRGGYAIYTTIDRKLQKTVDQTLNDPDYYPKNISYTVTDNKGKQTPVENAMEQSGAALIDNKTGRILAMGGGRNYEVDQINHATRPRQPGSTMKPIAVYGPAIELKQLGSGTAIDDVPMVWPDQNAADGKYFPFNWDKKFHGLMTAREALEQSYNIPALKVFHLITPKVGLDFVKKMGVTTIDDTDYNLASGIGGMSQGLTVQEATGAYATIPNAGVFRDTFMIEEIKDRHGADAYKHESKESKVFDPNTAYILNDMMKGVVRKGTASEVGAKFPGYAIAGKTGTTNEDKDAWFIGYTPDVTLGVWVGYNIPYPLKSGQGNTPKKLWNSIMGSVLPSLETRTKDFFPNPGGVRQVAVCRASGKLPTELCKQQNDVVTELFLAGTEPHEMDDVYVKAKYYEVNGKKYLANDSTPAYLVKEGIFIKREKYQLPNGNTAYLPLDHDKELPTDKDPRGDNESLKTTKVPSGVKVTASTGSSVTLAWNAVDGAKSYVVLRADSEAGPFQVLDEASGTAYTDGSVAAGKNYAYRIVSVDGDGLQSDPSQTVSVKPGATVAAPPSGVSVTPGPVGLTVSWQPANGATSYVIYRSNSAGSAYQKVTSVTATSYTDPGAIAGGTFYYTVAAVIDGKETPASAPASATAGGGGEAAAPPDSVFVSDPKKSGALSIVWSPVPSATGYVLERSENGGGWSQVARVDGTTYTDSGLTAGKPYAYRVRSVSADRTPSKPSSPATGTPAR